MRWKLEKGIHDSIKELIKTNKYGGGNTNNFLSLLIAATVQEENAIGTEEVIDECKTFYFAGKETTANLLTWAIVLLAKHRQSKAREQVYQVCGDSPPHPNNINALKDCKFLLIQIIYIYIIELMFSSFSWEGDYDFERNNAAIPTSSRDGKKNNEEH